MNKIAKILSVVLSVSLVIGVTVAMLVSAFAANAPKFSVDLVKESATEVSVSLSLVDEGFQNFDAQITAAEGLTLTAIEKSEAFGNFIVNSSGALASQNLKTGKISLATVDAYKVKGAIFTFTFTKSADKDVSKDDISVTFFTCSNSNGEEITATVVNNLPEPATEAPTEKPTEAPTEKPTEAPTEKPTEAPTEKPTEAPTEKPTEAPTEKPTEAPTEAPATTVPAAETTTAASSTGDTVNPETGDRLTATAAVVSLLAISGAAVVALRKKED